MALQTSITAFVRRSLSLALLGGALAACGGLGRPSVTPQTPHVGAVSKAGIDLNIELLVKNPNPFALVGQGLSGSLSLGEGTGKRVGDAHADINAPIPAKGSGTIDSRLQIAWTSLSALSEFIGRSQVPYTFDGALAIKGGPLDLSVPFQIHGYLEREQLLKLGAAGLRGLLR
jgi:LEA14-like dessication related protein